MERAIKLIDELLESGWYEGPPLVHGLRKIKKDSILGMSYRRTALLELKMFLESCPEHDPVFLIDKYRNSMNDLASSNRPNSFRFIFGVFYEVSTEVLDMLIAGGWKA